MAVYRHVLRGTYPGEIWSFRLHSEGATSLAAAQTAWDDAITAFGSVAYLATLCADVGFTETSTAELDVATGRQLTRVESPRTEVGTSVAACLPFQCAPVVSFRTASATRAGRGRMYAPSPAVDQQDGGRLTVGAQGALADAAQAMLAALSSAGLEPVLFSTTALTRRAITSLDVGDVIDTQRRRRNQLVEQRVSRQV